MKKETQDLAWACLPKEVRKEVRMLWELDTLPVHPDYDPDSVAEGAAYILTELFGLHNLNSDTEPEEMLMVERKYIQEMYADGVGTHYLLNLFDDKCLPDKEEPKREGWSESFKKYVEEGEDEQLPDHLDSEAIEILDMEEKELNLCELLKDCEGEEFYSPMFGDVVFKTIIENVKDKVYLIYIEYSDYGLGDCSYTLESNGSGTKNGKCVLYPSRALYEKHPLDARAAWMEWAEARKPKLEQEVYDYAKMCSMDVDGYKAIEAAVIFGMELAYKSSISEVREALQKFHENNTEK